MHGLQLRKEDWLGQRHRNRGSLWGCATHEPKHGDTVTAGLAKKQTPKEPVSVALHEAGALSLGEQKRPGTGWGYSRGYLTYCSSVRICYVYPVGTSLGSCPLFILKSRHLSHQTTL